MTLRMSLVKAIAIVSYKKKPRDITTELSDITTELSDITTELRDITTELSDITTNHRLRVIASDSPDDLVVK
jgi:cell division protein FtsL